MTTFTVRTEHRSQMIPITDRVQEVIAASGCQDGVCTVYVPHTTAAVTVNENADPDVAHDILAFVDALVPRDRPGFRHAEGNSDSHIKACFFGTSEALPVTGGHLTLGTWQGVFFCEFDGPRSRQVHVTVTPSAH